MSHRIVRRLVVVLVLSALLGSPATSLAGSRSAARHSRPHTAARAPLSWLWSTVASILEKAGCSGDPFGLPLAGTQETVDAGCSGDPFGQCLPGQ
jgi:hypothetical protein